MNITVSELSGPARESEIVRPLPSLSLGAREESGLVPMLTFVIWIGCVFIGIAGFVLPYLRPQAPARTPSPVIAELLNVDLTSEPLPPVNPAPPPPDLVQPPPLAKQPVVSTAPPMISVAAPSPQIAFVVPVEAPARIVPAREASFRTVEPAPIVNPAPEPVAPQQVTFGQGEGKQPAPEYPREALRQGQEGTVTMRMWVGEDGRVRSIEASSPSAWPLLNNAALRTARSRWQFTPGRVRFLEIAVRFELSR